jgi:hypothetical protein
MSEFCAASQLSFDSLKIDDEDSLKGTIGGDPKLQLTNGYFARFDQLSRILGSIAGRRHQSRVSRKDLIGDTGLSSVHVKNLCSLAVGIGLIKRISYNLLPLGELIAQTDRFFEDTGTLWACHYRLGSNPHNLIWQRLVNHILPGLDEVTTEKARRFFSDLEASYSEGSLDHHVAKELQVCYNAYTDQALARLRYLEALEPNIYTLTRRHAPLDPWILLFAIYDFRDRFTPGATAVEIPVLWGTENSPGRVFHLSQTRLRELLNVLHRRGVLTIERQAGLDQVALVSDFSPYDALEYYYAS